jgi:hypothetical protein
MLRIDCPHPDFTFGWYAWLLEQFRDRGYRFESFGRGSQLSAEGQRVVLMRHDIDFDLDKALEMAELEFTAGVSATYFFLVRSSHYNVLSASGSATIRRLSSRRSRP